MSDIDTDVTIIHLLNYMWVKNKKGNTSMSCLSHRALFSEATCSGKVQNGELSWRNIKAED